MKKLVLVCLGTVVALSSLVVLDLPAMRAQTAAPAAAPTHAPGDIAGDWQGPLEFPARGGQPAGKLRIVVKITKKDGGGWNAVDYSIDQNPRGMPCFDVTLKGTAFRYTIPSIDGTYEGQVSADGNSIAGTWIQGSSLPLVLFRATKETAWEIPEPPKPPTPMAADADPTFDVATIKPSDPNVPGNWFRVNGRNFSTHNISLAGMMKFAYGVHGKQIVNAPDWMDQDTFDVAAVPDGEGQPNDKQWKSMLAKLMADRYKLTFHHESGSLQSLR